MAVNQDRVRVKKEFTVYEDDEGFYILVDQPNAALQKLYMQQKDSGHDTEAFVPQQWPPKKEKNHGNYSPENQFVDDSLKLKSKRKAGKAKVDTFNKEYVPHGFRKLNIVDRKKLGAYYNWKAKPKVDTKNNLVGVIPHEEGHLLKDQPRWNSNSKVKHRYISTRVLSSQRGGEGEEEDSEDERLKPHVIMKQKHIPEFSAVPEGGEEYVAKNSDSKWIVLPSIPNRSNGDSTPVSRRSSGKYTQSYHQHPQSNNESKLINAFSNTGSIKDGNTSVRDKVWIPQIGSIVYNPKLKQWMALGSIERPTVVNDSPFSPDGSKSKTHDPETASRIRKYKEKTKAARAQEKLLASAKKGGSGGSKQQTYNQPAKSISFEKANVLWNVEEKVIEEEEEAETFYDHPSAVHSRRSSAIDSTHPAESGMNYSSMSGDVGYPDDTIHLPPVNSHVAMVTSQEETPSGFDQKQRSFSSHMRSSPPPSSSAHSSGSVHRNYSASNYRNHSVVSSAVDEQNDRNQSVMSLPMTSSPHGSSKRGGPNQIDRQMMHGSQSVMSIPSERGGAYKNDRQGSESVMSTPAVIEHYGYDSPVHSSRKQKSKRNNVHKSNKQKVSLGEPGSTVGGKYPVWISNIKHPTSHTPVYITDTPDYITDMSQ